MDIVIFCGFKERVGLQGMKFGVGGPIKSPPAANDNTPPPVTTVDRPKFKIVK